MSAPNARPVPCAWARFVGHRLQPRRVRGACAVVLTTVAILVGLSFTSSHRGQIVFGPTLGGDFAAFYTTGVLLDEHRADRLYDFWTHYRRLHELFPSIAPHEALPFAYPPFFAVALRPLSLFPYPAALLLWVLTSIALFSGGLALLLRDMPAPLRREWVTVLLLLLSFEPVVIECLVGGQTSAFGFFGVALSLALSRRARPFASGLALSLCLYKPTLLILIVPMLLVSRQFRALGGFTTGAAALGLISILSVGWQGCVACAEMLAGFAKNTAGNDPFFRTWKFVDAGAFCHLLLTTHPRGAVALTIAALVVPAILLVRLWWRTEDRSLTWATTLTWTLVMNVYVPIYDASIVGVAALLTAESLYHSSGGLSRSFKAILLLLWTVPWASQHVALATGLQPLTLVLAGLGVYQLRLAACRASLGLNPSLAIIRPFALLGAVEPQAANHLEGSFPRRAGVVLGRDGDAHLRAG